MRTVLTLAVPRTRNDFQGVQAPSGVDIRATFAVLRARRGPLAAGGSGAFARGCLANFVSGACRMVQRMSRAGLLEDLSPR
eukprot:14212716-Alexandrium_andersonii.AAC.1